MAVVDFSCLTSSITIWRDELVIYESVRKPRISAFPNARDAYVGFAYIAAPYSPDSPVAVPFAQTGIAISQFLLRIQ